MKVNRPQLFEMIDNFYKLAGELQYPKVALQEVCDFILACYCTTMSDYYTNNAMCYGICQQFIRNYDRPIVNKRTFIIKKEDFPYFHGKHNAAVVVLYNDQYMASENGLIIGGSFNPILGQNIKYDGGKTINLGELKIHID